MLAKPWAVQEVQVAVIQTRHLFPFGSFLYSKVGDIAFIQCHQLFFFAEEHRARTNSGYFCKV